MGQLHDDVQRAQAHVVSQVRADAEAGLRAIGEVVVQRDRLVEVQPVGEHEPLGVGVDTQLLVMGQRLFAPHHRVARVVAQTIKKFSEVEVEVAEEGVHADHVGQRGAEVATVLLHPVFERLALEVAQAHAERLVGLQILVRHGADGHQVQVAREQHVRRALEVARHLLLEGRHDLALPLAREAAAYAEVEKLERVAALRLVVERAQPRNLGGQALTAFGERGGGIEAAKVQLVDDGQHVDFERHHMHLRATGDDLELRPHGARGDELALEVEDAQEVDEVGAHEAQPAKVAQLVGLIVQRAQVIELLVHVGQQIGQRVSRLVATHERVLGLRLRVPVQHGLPHRELVQVGVEQAVDDRLHRVSQS